MEKGRIMMVDDDKAFLMLVSHLLGKNNFEVEVVSDSKIAYKKIIEFSPDLIILDVQMPGMDGETLLKILKKSKLTCHIPVIFLSGVSKPERIKASLDMGAEDFLTKPIHPNLLRTKIEKVMERIQQTSYIHNIISRYLGPNVAQLLLKEPEKLSVKGIRRPIASLFADIRGFSSIVETMEPEEVVNLLNHVLSDFSDSIFSTGGTIDKFLGDGIMAFWGAPLACEEMECHAVEAALLMMEKNKAFNQERRYPGGLEIQIGIGISVGNAVVGNIGSERRSDYTVIGESVNVSCRLENMAKPGQILSTKEIYEKIKDKFICNEVGELLLKGKTLPIQAYEVMGKI